MVKQKQRITQSRKTCAIHACRARILLAFSDFVYSFTNHNDRFITSFCTELPLFCTMFPENCNQNGVIFSCIL